LNNRLQAAKNALSSFVRKRPNDRIGLIGFADYAYTLSPPTLDHEQLLNSLQLLETEMIGNATGLASPIASAVSRLSNSTAPRRILVLFTDGVNTAAHRLTPRETAQLAKEKNVTIYTVGIGGKRSFVISNGMLMNYNNEFDEKTLQEIASLTGGKYFNAADQTKLDPVLQEINQLEKTNFEQPRYIEYHEYAPLLAGIALLFIVLAILSRSTFERTVP
jgi:Ca-activated chloride channel family protein